MSKTVGALGYIRAKPHKLRIPTSGKPGQPPSYHLLVDYEIEKYFLRFYLGKGLAKTNEFTLCSVGGWVFVLDVTRSVENFIYSGKYPYHARKLALQTDGCA